MINKILAVIFTIIDLKEMIIMVFKDKTYDILKWFCLIGFPAIITFFGVLGATLDWNFTQPVITIAVAFNTMLGTMLGISNIKYKSMTEYDDAGEEEDYE